MVCSNCGKEVRENATFCEECGAPLEEPVVIKMTKEDIKGATKNAKSSTLNGQTDKVAPRQWVGPAIDLPGYVNDIKTNVSSLLALIGALLMYLSPFFSWLWRKHGEAKSTANLFDLSRKVGDLSLDSKLLFVIALLVILTGLAMMVASAAKHLKFMQPYLDNKYIFMIPAIIGLVILILIFANSKYEQAYDIIMKQVEKSSSNVNMKFSGGRGFGPILYIGGLISYFASLVINMSNKR